MLFPKLREVPLGRTVATLPMIEDDCATPGPRPTEFSEIWGTARIELHGTPGSGMDRIYAPLIILTRCL